MKPVTNTLVKERDAAMPIKPTEEFNYATGSERKARQEMTQLLKACPIPDEEILENLGLFLTSKYLSRILCMHELYTQIVDIPGIVVEFGTRWGPNVALYAALRGIYDTFNRHRKIVAFDTFEGFPSISREDGGSRLMKKGNLALPQSYEDYLRQVMDCQERLNPLSHITKYEVIKGDATVEFPNYIRRHPETIVAFAYFDMDIYKPTKQCLEAIMPLVIKGSVIGFDELNDPDSPGETVALMEAVGLNKVRLKRYRYASRVSYFIFE